MHYYFADAVSILLELSLCVVFTAQVMKFFYRRDRQQRGGAAVQEQSQNEAGDEDHEDEEEKKGFQLKTILAGALALGCWFFCASYGWRYLHFIHGAYPPVMLFWGSPVGFCST